MTGYMFCIGTCFGCGRTFSFNPDRVPSVMYAGQREPICASCVERANPMRAENGLEPIVPLEGAYAPTEAI